MIKKVILIVFVFVFAGISYVSVGQDDIKESSKFTAGIVTGYYFGYGVQANIKANDFAKEFPFELRLGVGYTMLSPGHAADARRIFINNATNGVPEKKGTNFDYRLDFLLPTSIFGVENSYLIFGPRYSNFKGNFKYVGGNEDFDVKTKQWGVGAGIENHFAMTKNIDLVLVFGLDYYFDSTLKGHDTSYSPNNDNVNARNDKQNDNTPFQYKDADKAINQPKIMPRAMIGVSFGL